MKYVGDLYAKIGGKYVKLREDSEFVDRLECENELLKKELAEALSYATNLLTGLVKRYYPDNNTFQPLKEIVGVLTQIDNACAGIAILISELERHNIELVGISAQLTEDAKSECYANRRQLKQENEE